MMLQFRPWPGQCQQWQLTPAVATAFGTAFAHVGNRSHLAVRRNSQPGTAGFQVPACQYFLPVGILPPVHAGSGAPEKFIPVGRHHQREAGILANGEGNQAHGSGVSFGSRGCRYSQLCVSYQPEILPGPLRLMTLFGVFILYLLLGALAGTMAGLFGIGGGLVIVPVLIFSFGFVGVSPEIAAHLAIGTSLPPSCSPRSAPSAPTTSTGRCAG